MTSKYETHIKNKRLLTYKFFPFCLSSKCLKNIPFDKYEKNFTFIVGEKPYQTSRFVADLISPRVRKLHYTDPSLDEFLIDMSTIDNHNKSEKDYFDEFLSLCSFKTITVDQTRQKYFLHYFHKLGYIEEYFPFQPDQINIKK